MPVLAQCSYFFHCYEALMVNEFHGYLQLVFNPTGTALGKKIVEITGDVLGLQPSSLHTRRPSKAGHAIVLQ